MITTHLGICGSFAGNPTRFHALRAVGMAGASNAGLHHSFQEVHAANDEPHHAHVLHDNEHDDQAQPLVFVFDRRGVGHEKSETHRR